ncbi:hypothetical protein ACFL6Y_02350 [Elusimicrobiota bacterium]
MPDPQKIIRDLRPLKPVGLFENLIWLFGRIPVFRYFFIEASNAFGGAIDRRVNNKIMKRLHAAHSLPVLAQVSENIFRGAQPSGDGFHMLKKELNITKIINLRMEDDTERDIIRDLGMEYVHLAIPDTDIPTPWQVIRFLDMLDNFKDGRMFIHCASGAMRAALMIGLYRLYNGVSADKAMEEVMASGFDRNWLAGPRGYKLLNRFAKSPQDWIAKAKALPNSQKHSRTATLRL